VIKDFVKIHDDSIVPSNTVIPQFSEYSGFPAKFINDAVDGMQEIMEEFCKESYFKTF
jgi:dynactin-5